MNKEVFFAFGRTPALSAAELASVFLRDTGKAPAVELGKNFAIVKHWPLPGSDQEALKRLLAGLGGTVKIGRVVGRGKFGNIDDMRKGLLKAFLESTSGDHRDFGLSFLAGQHLNRVKGMGMHLKRALSANGVKARFVSSEHQPLPSVVVEREDLLDPSGAELMIAQLGLETIIARTEVVQPFAALSKRDYGRPERDIVSGMLPPKLAIALLNLAHARPNSVVLDPFSGSGTVLQEAELMGVKKIIGSDVNEEAIRNSHANLRWLREKELANTEGISLSIRHLSFKELPKALGADSVDAIATEPFLGPPLRKDTHPGLIRTAVQDTSKLYDQFVMVAREILKPGGRLAMIVPQFRISKQGFREPHFRTDGFHWPDPLPTSWKVDWKKIVYGRPDQHVFRKIVVLVKK